MRISYHGRSGRPLFWMNWVKTSPLRMMKSRKYSAAGGRYCINIIRETLVREGAPADIIQGIEDPSINLTQELMKRCDLVIATGGRPMVKSAYSSGVPAYGSGAGNATVIIDNTCNTPEYQAEAASNTRMRPRS